LAGSRASKCDSVDLVRVRERTIGGVILALLAGRLGGCTPAPPEVADGGIGNPMGSTGMPPETTTEGSATVASVEGSASDDPASTTLPLDGTTTEEPPATSGSSSEGPGSSSDGGMMESSGGGNTTGEPAECHPILAEVLYDPPSGDNNEEWIKLYNPCAVEIELDAYSLGWGGTSYVQTGTMNLSGSIGAGECFLVGGTTSNGDNGNPVYDLAQDFSGDLQNSGDPGDGIALFLGDAASIMASTIPVDAVIYGSNNASNLLDADGNTPAPHVADAPEGDSIRRTALAPTWIIEANPMPNACPPL
jgi:hypothetical protein